MAIIQGNAKQGSTRGFYPKELTGSLRFNDDDSAYLSWTPASSGNKKTFTFSFWVKRATLGTTQRIYYHNESSNTNQFDIEIGSGDNFGLTFRENGTTNKSAQIFTSAVFRDPSAWYHFVVSYNSDTASPFCKIYVNGVEQTDFSTNITPVQNDEVNVSTAGKEYNIGRDQFAGGNLFDGYLAEFYYIDGTAHDADAFGETKNGVWVPKNITASDFTMGTNGFHLTFEDDTTVEAFNTTLHRGSGSTQSVTGVGFSPDLVWIKRRDSIAHSNLFDTVRGPRIRLFSGTTAADEAGSLISFDADGFTDDGIRGDTGASGGSYVAWCWDAGANNASTGHSSVTYTGNGGTQTISGLPFRPDLLWIKNRDAAGESHNLCDSVRGATKNLRSNDTTVEDSTARVSSFTNDGFILGGNYSFTNNNNINYVAWAWDAGDSDPVSNNVGDVTSTVKASTVNGFSVVTYTATGSGDIEVGHGLSQAPDFIIGKTRNQAYDWRVYHSAVGATKTLSLNGTSAASTNNAWGQTEPTSTVFTAGRGGDENMNFASGDTIVAYCFHDVTGKQKFGTYDGDHTNGVTVNCGFRPGFVMVKTASGEAGDWEIYDSSRGPFGSSERLEANTTDAEPGSGGDGAHVNFTSTGFELVAGIQRTSTNKTGNTYIYAAFAGSYSDYITDYDDTVGSIPSRSKASDATGFSVVSYHGTGSAGTIKHGLSAAPNWIIVKSREGGFGWSVYHSGIDSTNPADYNIFLHATNARSDDASHWNDTEPTSSVFSVGTNNGTNDSRYLHIAYCWAEKTGYSKFGSYTGTGSNLTINFGFRPAFFLTKSTSAGDPWVILDATRETVNDRNFVLQPNSSAVEDTDNDDVVEFTDTGVVIKSTSGWSNRSGIDYIYAAFADTREAAFWLDQSGNDNDWQPNNLDHNDTVSDSPTDNFATLNPLSVPSSPSRTFSNGNLRFDAGANNAKATGTILLPTSGQYYWEVTQLGGTTFATVGVSPSTYNNEATGRIGYRNDGQKIDETNSLSSYGATYQSGDTIGVAFDADADTLEFYKNGTSQGVAFTGMAARSDSGLVPWIQAYTSTPLEINFGQQPFKYGPPE